MNSQERGKEGRESWKEDGVIAARISRFHCVTRGYRAGDSIKRSADCDGARNGGRITCCGVQPHTNGSL